jgi:hypothetical protein
MDIYSYVAQSDLPASKAVITRFGFSTWGGQPLSVINDPEQIAQALQSLVQTKQDSALMAIADIHPDKDLLYQKFQEEQAVAVQNAPEAKPPCGCGGHSAGVFNMLTGHGQQSQKKDSGIYLTQTNAILAIGISMIALAIIAKN